MKGSFCWLRLIKWMAAMLAAADRVIRLTECQLFHSVHVVR